MTDRQAFAFDGAGDFRGEPQSCGDDPTPRACACRRKCLRVRVDATRRAAGSQGSKMMILIQLNDEDKEDDAEEEDDDDSDVDYTGVQSVPEMFEAEGSVGQPLH